MKVVGKQCSWNMGIGISLGLHHVTALSSTRQLQAINLYHYPIYGNTTQLSNTTGFQLKFAQPVAGLKRELVRGGAVHGKVLENGKGVRGNKNWVKMWGSNCIKLVFGLVFPNPVCGAKIASAGAKTSKIF